IGVNTMIFSTSGSSAGLGFAVPVDTVNRIIPDLIRNGRITRAGLGVGIAANPYGEDGLVITYISKGSGADKAGLRGITRDEWGRTYVGDIILEVDGKKLKSYNDIFQSLENKNIGDRVKVKILRADKIENLTIELSPLEQ
ncbi:MAG: S1C family serine protease, partial [Bacteriovoracaceae bacterium]